MKKYIFLFFAIVVVFIVVGTFLYNRTLIKQQQLEKMLEETEVGLGIKTYEAINSKDFSKCTELSNTYKKTVCRNNIALRLADETGDISYCQEMDDKLSPIASCVRKTLFDASAANENIKVCAQTNNQEIRAECEDNFYPALALKKQDVGVCDDAPNKTKIDFCNNSYILQTALANPPLSLDCSLFVSQDAKEDCKLLKQKRVEQLSDLSVCSEMKSDPFIFACPILILAPAL